MVARANQQMRDLVSDHPSEQLAFVNAGKRRQGLHAIGEHRGERAAFCSMSTNENRESRARSPKTRP